MVDPCPAVTIAQGRTGRSRGDAAEACLSRSRLRHRAGLNFGDCISYATARLEAMPLLFKGEDFRLTDIEAAA